jgi:ABC-type transporter Mla MlaB component
MLDFSESGHDGHLLEAQESVSGIGATFEEAAVLYANGNDDEALAVLEPAVTGADATVGEGAWLMLLDLFRLLGMAERFESRVMDYATRFERSPPPWEDLSGMGSRSRAGAAPLINLSGQLSASAERQFEQIATIARRSAAVRIDVSRVKGVDDGGCAVWRRMLEALTRERIEVSLLNVQSLANLLEKKVSVGRAEARDTWLLLLELRQYTGDQEKFENLAVDYAVTFEESPPSWEERGGASVARQAELAPEAAEPDCFVFEGELTGAGNERLKQLAAFAAERAQVRVDCGRLRRVDFVCAGTLFNILVTLQAQGKLVSLDNVNAMVAGLLRVMSVDTVARVTLRH